MPRVALALLAFPLLADAACAKMYAQCFGDWQFNNGLKMCCEADTTCHITSEWWGMCLPTRPHLRNLKRSFCERVWLL